MLDNNPFESLCAAKCYFLRASSAEASKSQAPSAYRKIFIHFLAFSLLLVFEYARAWFFQVEIPTAYLEGEAMTKPL